MPSMDHGKHGHVSEVHRQHSAPVNRQSFLKVRQPFDSDMRQSENAVSRMLIESGGCHGLGLDKWGFCQTLDNLAPKSRPLTGMVACDIGL